MAVKHEYDEKRKSTKFWPEGFPSFSLEVPDGASGIFLGNHAVDDVIAKDMAGALTAAAELFVKKLGEKQ